MKCYKPNTDQEAEFSVFANGFKCDEYILPSTEALDADVAECFIPVKPGDQLTVQGTFSGSILLGRFDLLADGSFLADKVFESNKDGSLKYHKKKKIDVQTVLNAQRDASVTSLMAKGEGKDLKIVEGNIHVKALEEGVDDRFIFGNGVRLSVGSLAVIVSVNQHTRDNYEGPFKPNQTCYPDKTCGDWRHRTGAVKANMILPRHELEVKVTNNELTTNKQKKFLRHFAQTRPGSRPWAKLIFYYRTKDQIDYVGCIARPSEAQAVEPADPDSFTPASQEKKPTPSKAAAKVKDQPEEDEGNIALALHASRGNPASRGDSMFMTPPPAQHKRKATSSPPDQQSTATRPPAKRKLFGQPFPESLSISLQASPYALPQRDALASAVAACYDARRDTTDTKSSSLPHPSTNGPSSCITVAQSQARHGQETDLPEIKGEELDEAATAAGSYLKAVDTTPASPVPAAQIQSGTVRAKDEALGGFAANEVEQMENGEQEFHEPQRPTKFTPSVGMPGGVTPSAEAGHEVSPLARQTQTQTDETRELRQSLRESNHSAAASLEVDGDSEKSNSNRAASVQSSITAVKREQASELVHLMSLHSSSTKRLETEGSIESSFDASEAQVDGTQNERAARSNPTPTSDTRAASHTPVISPAISVTRISPEKTHASSFSISRESTPSKRARLYELAERKAKLEKRVEEKKARKLAAKQALEERQRLRKAEERRWAEEERLREEAMLAEIEELERMDDMEDEELEQLAQAGEEADREYEAMKREREGGMVD